MREVRWSQISFFLGILLLCWTSTLRGAPWIVITEIHYNPPAGENEEFLEILNREPPRADLSGWTLEGEVSYRFPRGTIILPGEYLVIARNPQVLKARYPALRRILGPFTGRLDNKGGSIALRNRAGGRACRVQYDNRGLWTAISDGTGHSLSILDPLFDPDDPESWAPSSRMGGTPGAPNFPQEGRKEKPIVRKGATWKYWRGSQAPGRGWQELNFDDRGWESGRSGFGYGDDDDSTLIDDMQGSYLSIFTRHAFQAGDPAALQNLLLRVDYDDGFIAYLNGREVARASMGAEGLEVTYNQPAPQLHEAGVPSEFDLGPAARWLVPGKNVLAVQVHNGTLDSSDLSLLVELAGHEGPKSLGSVPRPSINEVHFTGGPEEAFIEMFNSGSAAIDLNGYFLSDDPRNLRKFQISKQTILQPHSFAVLSSQDLGGAVQLSGADLFLTLTEPSGGKVVDALPVKGKNPEGEGKADPLAGKPRGRFPDGSQDIAMLEVPTPGAANRIPVIRDLVINEIMYHPISGDEKDTFIELYNRGGNEISLQGYRLSRAVSYSFEKKESIKPGGYLVVAKDPAELSRKYRLSSNMVSGPFRGNLSSRKEELILRDPWGNVADRVLYADREPWPKWADGLGSSLELIHPDLDNELPASWAGSDDRSRAKWETFSYAKEHRLFNGQNLSEFQFLLLTEGECLIDNIRVSGLFDEGFESGDSAWQAMGTHERSGIYREDAASGKISYRIVAEGRGNSRNNYVTRPVPGGLNPGRPYRVAFRAKWQRGSPLLLSRTPGQGVAQTHSLTIPSQLGTPGSKNSTFLKDAPPSIDTPCQVPIAPASNQPVALSARISGRVPVREAYIHYRRDGNPQWERVALQDDGSGFDGKAGDGIWGGQIPGLPAGKVEFYLAALDGDGKLGTFPQGAPLRRALYAAGLTPSSRFPTYTLLVPDTEWSALAERPRMSNRLADATLVYGNSRIFYNVGLRRRGSPFTRSRSNWRIVLGADNLDGRSTLTLDGQGGEGTDFRERLTYWCIHQLQAPTVRHQYIYFRILGHVEGVYEDVEKVDRDFLANWFGQRPDAREEDSDKKSKAGSKAAGESREGGLLHKVDDYWELPTSGRQGHQEAFLMFKTRDPEDYRWNFPPRANSVDEDFEPLLKLLFTFDGRATPDRQFLAELEKSFEIDEWLRVLAARTLADDWDTIGRRRGKNAFLYLSFQDRRWRLLPWDCDLAWKDNPTSEIFSPRFPGIRRILEVPVYRRRFLGYLDYLARRKLEPKYLGTIMGDIHDFCGASIEGIFDFTQTRRDFILPQIPRYPLRLVEIRRVSRSGEPDVARATGTAPPIAMRFRLNGREGTVQLIGESQWAAEFPVGPEGGIIDLQALDFGGHEIAKVNVRVRPRSGAMPLPPLEPETVPPPEEVVSVSPEGESPPPPPQEEQPPLPEETVAVPPGQQVPPAGGQAPPAGEIVDSGPSGETGKVGEAEAVLAEGEGDVGEPPLESREGISSFPQDQTGEEETVSSVAGFDRQGIGTRRLGRPKTRTRRFRVDDIWDTGEGTGEVIRPEKVEASMPEAQNFEEGISGEEWDWLLPLLLILGIAQLPVILLIRKFNLLNKLQALFKSETLQKVQAIPKLKAEPAVPKCLQDLGDQRFEKASKALERLCEIAGEDIPALLEALEDDRRTPFQKIRRSGRGFSALPASGPTEIRVRHLAALFLEKAIGKPPVQKPGRLHWQSHWEQVRKATKQ